jgi:hypothetical protein
MRRLIYTFVGAAATLGLTASFALGVSNQVHCGTRYTPRCVNPKVTVQTISVSCHPANTTFRLPNMTFTSVAGLRQITVTVRSTPRTIYNAKNLGGIAKRVIRGLALNTRGLSPGVHTISIVVTDTRGKRTTTTLRFVVCQPPPPKFTG